MTQTKETRTTVRLMKAVTNLLALSSGKELAALASELEKRAAAAKAGAAAPANSGPEPQRAELVSKAFDALKSAQSREAGRKILEDLNPTRRELVGLAALFSVHVTKEDNIARLFEKIIGAAIGSRLSSLAIRGEAFDNAPPKP